MCCVYVGEGGGGGGGGECMHSVSVCACVLACVYLYHLCSMVYQIPHSSLPPPLR